MEAGRTPMAAAADRAYDAEMLAELEALFGRSRLLALLAGLRSEIDARLSAVPSDPESLGKTAHALVSTSGALGFMPLSQACVELERACLVDGDVSVHLANTRAAAADAKLAIDDLCGPTT